MPLLNEHLECVTVSDVNIYKLLPVLMATQAASPMSTNYSLSEYESGREIGRNIAGAGVTVAYCKTDGDSCLHKGVVQSIQEAYPSYQVKRLADVVHLSQT